MGLWDKVKGDIIESQGDIADIPGIPQHIKDVYKTSFTTSPYAFIEVAARAQKWVDQGLSRNMYLETRDIDETMKIYKTAWEKGVKTTYYLHMKPRHTAEQSTVSVNKAQKMGKVGFAAVASLQKEKDVAPQTFAVPLQKTLELESVAMPSYVESMQAGVPVKEAAPAQTHIEKKPEAAEIIKTSVMSSSIEEDIKTPLKMGGFSKVSVPAASQYAAPQAEMSEVREVPIQNAAKADSNPAPMAQNAPSAPRKYNVILPEDPGATDICIGCE